MPIHLAAAEIPNITGTSREQIGPKESLPRAARSLGWLKWCIHAISVGGLKDHTVSADGLTPFTNETVLDVPGSLRPVATTGHTSGHTSYLIGDTGVLAAGDAVVTGHLTLKASGVPQMLPTPFHHNPIGAELTAAKLLSGVDFDVLATGHGPQIRVPAGGHLAIH